MTAAGGPGPGADGPDLVARLPGGSLARGLIGRSQLIARRAVEGPWRVAVTEDSMRPALEPGDWLLVDPTIRVWPRRGSIVVVREPGADLLAIKRIVARPGDVIRTTDGPIRLSPTQAWLLGDERSVSRDSRVSAMAA